MKISLNFFPPHSYEAFTFPERSDRGIMQITKTSCNRLPPRKIFLLTSILHESDSFEVNRYFHFFMLFFKRFLTV